jgi:myo-inositol-1(or 4)-monophosphatase
MVQILAPYSRAIKSDEASHGAAAAAPGAEQAGSDEVVAALAAAAPASEAPKEPAKKKGPVRIRKADAQ